LCIQDRNLEFQLKAREDFGDAFSKTNRGESGALRPSSDYDFVAVFKKRPRFS